MNLGGSVGGYTTTPEPPLVTALASPSSTKITEETPNVIVPLTENSECGTPVPEPATMLLFGTGLAGIATKLRKRARQREAT